MVEDGRSRLAAESLFPFLCPGRPVGAGTLMLNSQVQIPGQVVSGCVSLDKSAHLSEPHFSAYYEDMIIILTSRVGKLKR